MKTLICTVGLPRAGKSTFCKEMISKGWVVINPDSIRLALHGKPVNPVAEGFVWRIVETSIKALFLVGHDKIILDATCIDHKSRKPWLKLEGVQTFFKVFDAPKEVCKQRALLNNQLDLIDVIERMAQRFQPLSSEEIEYIAE